MDLVHKYPPPSCGLCLFIIQIQAYVIKWGWNINGRFVWYFCLNWMLDFARHLWPWNFFKVLYYYLIPLIRSGRWGNRLYKIPPILLIVSKRNTQGWSSSFSIPLHSSIMYLHHLQTSIRERLTTTKKSIKLQTGSEVLRPPPLRQLQTNFDFFHAFFSTLNAVIQYKMQFNIFKHVKKVRVPL